MLFRCPGLKNTANIGGKDNMGEAEKKIMTGRICGNCTACCDGWLQIEVRGHRGPAWESRVRSASSINARSTTSDRSIPAANSFADG